MTLQFKVVEQTLFPQPTNSLPRRGSREYLKLDFEFSEEVEEATKTIYFTANGYSSAKIYEGEPVQVEDYFTQVDFAISIGIIDGGTSYITNEISIAQDPSSTVWLTLPPTTDVPAYLQLVQKAEEARQAADAAKNAAIAAKEGLPIARGETADGSTYLAYGEVLPEVKAGSDGAHVGKGRQIVFIPGEENTVEDPTLAINDGEGIVLRLRAEKNQGDNAQRPDATRPIPVGALMRGVPYTLTFCGMYWLVDSMMAGVSTDAAWVAFEIDEKGDLYVITADSFRGAEFFLTEDGELEVVTHE